MANICDNTFYCYSDDNNNIKYISDFLTENLKADVEEWENSIDAYFDSKWVFPEELMNEMYNNLPNKDDIYMRCLSVEYGCDYVSYHKCNEDGWECIV